MIAKTIFAISSEESRYTLNGALMVLKPESITMVATDGHRLAHIEKAQEAFPDVSRHADAGSEESDGGVELAAGNDGRGCH